MFRLIQQCSLQGYKEQSSNYKVEKKYGSFCSTLTVILICATYYSVILFLRKRQKKLLSTVKGIVFTVSVSGAQTELGRGAFVPSALSHPLPLIGKVCLQLKHMNLSVVNHHKLTKQAITAMSNSNSCLHLPQDFLMVYKVVYYLVFIQKICRGYKSIAQLYNCSF